MPTPARSDPADLLPARLRRPIMILVFAAELGLGLGLIGTAVKFGRDWPTLPATVVRTGAALFFLVAVGVLNEMRQQRADAGCGILRRAQRHARRPAYRRPPGPAVRVRRRHPRPAALRMPSSQAEAELWLAVLAFSWR